MIDAEPVDQTVVHELEHLPVRRLEYLRVLDAHPGELADVEESAVPTALGIPVEELRAELAVAPERVLLLRGRHVVRDDVEQHAEAGLTRRGTERTELGLAAQALGDAGRVDDVVAVRRAAACLQRGREIEVRSPELGDVRDGDLPRRAEVEVPRELEAVGAPEVGHRQVVPETTAA